MNILWFRRDLRLADNASVAAACQGAEPVFPCFVIDPWFYQHPEIGAARVRFLFESLAALDANLRSRGSQLYIFHGNTLEILQDLTHQLCDQGRSPTLYFNRDGQAIYGRDRDRAILKFYRELKLPVQLGLNTFIQTQGDRRETWHRDYYDYQHQPCHPAPERINTPALDLNLPQLTLAELYQQYSRFFNNSETLFCGGEPEAIATLDSFLQQRFWGYHWKLSRPWLAQQGATSHLSPHLMFGTISCRTVYQQAKARAQALDNPKATFALKAFRDRLRWHDSFTQRFHYHPELGEQNRFAEFDELYTPEPLDGQKLDWFIAWQQGLTGFPLVDASMRQLQQMGWLNFRMRAMCATFLTINCGISWHHGARHYMNCLVDGDVAIDHWQWQMQAGVTNPMSGNLRIYNPTKNLRDRDEDLQFVHDWLPELRGFTLDEVLQQVYWRESHYPLPMLDWAATRRVNGKRVSQLRDRVQARLRAEGGAELEEAIASHQVVKKYWQNSHQRYRDSQQQSDRAKVKSKNPRPLQCDTNNSAIVTSKSPN
ncbi:MAG: deoxyribodipyrimidine photo-lyase [Spirulinaceae cyanobacterium SM2_1_0]|nr:deoxyribodipyrimidine photo-lyase [Spirulinaceae cyanobacterium SM2_1_0]